MTQEEKDLLLKDLCARLPYENVYLKSSDIASLIDSISLNERYDNRDERFNRIIKERKAILEFKPYLRPLSSMTDEERDEFMSLGGIMSYSPEHDHFAISAFAPEAYNYLNSHYFDYRGLIPMKLALEALEGIYGRF